MKKNICLAICGLLVIGTVPVLAGERARELRQHQRHSLCRALPNYEEVTYALTAAVAADANGLNNDMWATVVDRDGTVCLVTRSGAGRGDQWPGSRVISAQKANAANAFSLPARAGGLVPGLSLSTANLFTAVQPNGSLFGLQHSNPVDTKVAYGGSARHYGHEHDPMVGKKIGGVNVFGGGLALYDDFGNLLGAIGVSGDTSCRDHIVSWITRNALRLDHVPAGVSPTGDDNMIHDFVANPKTDLLSSPSGFGHPACGFGEEPAVADLPSSYPIGD